MATTTPPAIDALPSAPDPNNRSTFNTLAYPWAAALPAFGTQVSAVGANVKANADDAKVNADSATAQAALAAEQTALAVAQVALAQSAATSAGSIAWVSGTTYAVGDLRYSPLDFQNYRRSTAGAGTTDPSLDGAKWTAIGVPAVLAGKTIEAGTFTNGYTEEVYAPAAGSAFTVDLANGSIQGFTTNANTTITLPAVVAGKSFQLQIAFGGAHTLTFAGGTLVWGTTPTFSGAASKTDIVNFTANVAGTKWIGAAFAIGSAT